MRHVFIINPAAGKKDSTKEIRERVRNLRTSEPVEIYLTRYPGDAQKRARYEAEQGDHVRIYSCGGDGTANEVLNGLAGYSNCAMGIIPIGSGNDFVRALEKYSREDFLDVEHMIQGEEVPIDLIECQGKYSMNVLSVGYDSAVAKNVDKFKKLPLVSGSLAYKMSIVYCLFSKRKHKIKILLDGEPFQKTEAEKTTLLAIAANGRFYGGGIKAAPLSVMDDGLMDFIHVDTISVVKFLSIIGKYIKGTHLQNPKYRSFLSFLRCKKIQFLADEPVDVNLDGEIFSMKNPEINVLPGALRIIMPKKAETLTNKSEKQESKLAFQG